MKRFALAALIWCAAPGWAAESPRPAVPVLALLAPTTGKQASIGKRVVALVALALDGQRVRVVVFDTAVSPTTAAMSAVASGASLVLGPVGAKETAEVAAALAPTRLSMISLSGVSGSDGPPRRLRGRTGTAEEVQAICERVATLSGARIALVAPDGSDGDEAAIALTGCLTGRGEALDRVVRFSPAQRDLGRVVEELAQGAARPQPPTRSSGPWPAPPRAGRAFATAGPRPTVLVLAVTSGQAAALLPALAVRGWFEEPSPLRIFATGSFEGPELATAASHLGAVSVVERCPWNDQRDVARDFVERFETAFGEPPTRFDAEVFDAARMVDAGRAALPPGVTSPEAWTKAILRQGQLEGVCGELSWTAQGTIAHPLPLWSIDADGALFPRAASWDD